MSLEVMRKPLIKEVSNSEKPAKKLGAKILGGGKRGSTERGRERS